MTTIPDLHPEVEASFRVMGSYLDPDFVSAKLGLEPDHSHRRGEPRLGKAGRQYSDYTEGIWILKSRVPASASIEEHVDSLIRVLACRGTVVKELVSTGLRVDLLIGVIGIAGNFNFSVGFGIIKEVAELGLTIGFDLYTAK